MAGQKLQQARELILAKRYDEARAILHAINHPAAAQWLARLDEISPPPSPSESSAFSSNELLEVARDLLLEEQFDEARELLQDINHPVARQWLAKLDSGIAPQNAAAPAEPTEKRPKTHLDILQWEDQVQFLADQERFDEARLVLKNIEPEMATQWQRELDLIAPSGNPENDSPQPPKLIIQAQHLILEKRVDEARFILENIEHSVAVNWLKKLEEFNLTDPIWPDLWLDLYEFTLELPEGINAKSRHCQYCSRLATQAPACPERKYSHCPVALNTSETPGREKLTRLLAATSHQNQTRVDAILQSTAPDTLQKWRNLLYLQQQGSSENDPRSAVVEQVKTRLDETIAQKGGGDASTARKSSIKRIKPLQKKIRRLPKRK